MEYYLHERHLDFILTTFLDNIIELALEKFDYFEDYNWSMDKCVIFSKRMPIVMSCISFFDFHPFVINFLS